MAEYQEIWDYVLLLAFGGVVVGVHSHSLFSQRLSNSGQDSNEDPLAALSLPIILGRSDYRRGFAVYLLANELLYLVLTSSTTILSLVYEVIGNQKMVGVLTEDVSPNTLYPVLASSLVVLMSQAKPTSEIEHTFRRIAHGVAGMPRNLEEVQAKIRACKLDEVTSEIEYLNSGRLAAADVDSSAKYLIYEAAKEKSALAVNAARMSMSTDHDDRNFKLALEKVHCLFSWTLGYDGECIWVSENTRQITKLFQPLALEYYRLNSEIDALVRDSEATEKMRSSDQYMPLDEETKKNRWRSVISSVQSLEQQLTIVISLLLINQPDINLKDYPFLKVIRDKAMMRSEGGEPGVAEGVA